MRQIHKAAGAAMLALTSLAAEAQTPEPRLMMDRGFYLGAGIGRARSIADCGTVCDNRDTTWQGYAGYQLNRHFAFEAGYSDFGTMTTSGTLFGGTAVARSDTTAWEISALAIAPFAERFSAYVKIGLFRYESEATGSGTIVGTTTMKDWEYSFGLGVQYAFTNQIGARLEWQRYNDVGTGVEGFGKDSINVWRLSGRVKF